MIQSRRLSSRLPLLVLFLACSHLGFLNLLKAQQEAPKPSEGEKVLAVVGDQPITEEQVLQRSATELQSLALRELEFEAKQGEERHNILRRHLDEIIADELLRLEAQARGTERAQLLEQEVYSKLAEPTEEEIDALYEANKARLRRTKEQLRNDIIAFLKDSQAESLQGELIAWLKSKYEVEDFLQPIRYEMAIQGHPAKGDDEAPVVLVEFSDFECPYCPRMNDTLNALGQLYGSKVRRVFRQFPLNSIHPNAQKAAEASLCAADQNRFWEMHARLFEHPRKLELDDLYAKASEIGLDEESFRTCLTSGRNMSRVQEDLQAGVGIGVSGTPALFVNGRPVRAATLEAIAEVIEEEIRLRKGIENAGRDRH